MACDWALTSPFLALIISNPKLAAMVEPGRSDVGADRQRSLDPAERNLIVAIDIRAKASRPPVAPLRLVSGKDFL